MRHLYPQIVDRLNTAVVASSPILHDIYILENILRSAIRENCEAPINDSLRS